MPLRAQPRGRKGTVDRPYSALNLRLALAGFGLVICGVLAGLLFAAGRDVLGVAMLAAAVVAAVDLVVVQLRRQSRRGPQGRTPSLFG